LKFVQLCDLADVNGQTARKALMSVLMLLGIYTDERYYCLFGCFLWRLCF